MAFFEQRAVEILGVKLPKRAGSSQTLRLIVDSGLVVNAFESLVDYANITRLDLSRAADIPLRTVQRREASHARKFERDESDRLARVARLYAMAEDVLGSRDEAQRWMKTPNRALDGARPLDELDTEIASREVEDLLGRIRYGVFG
jgi:putative toxin-antitoxin system antitoxin component (TIGR02293 family)